MASGRCDRGSSRSDVLRRGGVHKKRCACRRYRLVRQLGVWQRVQHDGSGRTWVESRDRGQRDRAFGIATRVGFERRGGKARERDHFECLILDS